jgi:hypothetical protein
MPLDDSAIQTARRHFWNARLSGDFEWGSVAAVLPPILKRRKVTEESFNKMLIEYQQGKASKQLDRIASDLFNRAAQERESTSIPRGKVSRVRLENGTQVTAHRPSYQTGGNFSSEA